MKNIHILPTDKPSRLQLQMNGNFHIENGQTVSLRNYQNIYITNDEEIKEGDWVIFNELEIVKCTYSKNGEFLFSEPLTSSSNHHFSYFKKIILTTDDQLIKDGVQDIDNEFLEWFVKNPSCEEVEEEKTYVTNSGLGYREYAVLDSNFKVIEINANISQTSYYLGKITALYPYEYDINYKIIIPKEEHKQEITIEEIEQQITLTELEEAAERLYPGVDRQVDRMLFINGAKWQQERMYSEEESIQKIIDYVDFQFNTNGELNSEIKKWFNQFKKK